MKTVVRTLFILLFVLVFGCSKSNVDLSDVNSRTIVDTEIYSDVSGAAIIDAEIVGDVLKITIGASGCDGNAWKARLVSSEGVIKTNPPKREVKIEFTNPELCHAVITKTFVFDLKPLRWSDTRELYIVIHTNGENKSLLYKY